MLTVGLLRCLKRIDGSFWAFFWLLAPHTGANNQITLPPPSPGTTQKASQHWDWFEELRSGFRVKSWTVLVPTAPTTTLHVIIPTRLTDVYHIFEVSISPAFGSGTDWGSGVEKCWCLFWCILLKYLEPGSLMFIWKARGGGGKKKNWKKGEIFGLLN